jgi:hypothetical protein
MVSRDEYVQKLKSQIEEWNAEAAKWEAKAKAAQAGMQAEYWKQLQQYRARRDAALAELRRMQSASADAWRELMGGADDAMKNMQEAFDKARAKFDKK